MLADGTVEKKAVFELGAGKCVLDASSALAQIQSLALGRSRGKQTFETFSQVGCLVDVGLSLRIASAQQKYSRYLGKTGKNYAALLRRKRNGVLPLHH